LAKTTTKPFPSLHSFLGGASNLKNNFKTKAHFSIVKKKLEEEKHAFTVSTR
jgi:hypothetical protein